MALTGTPVSDYKPVLVWENTSDTPIVATALSKSTDLSVSYLDFKYNDSSNPHHREGTILMADPGTSTPIKLVLKRGVLFSIINQVDEVTYPNGQYKIFDSGLDDVWISYDDKDDAAASVTGWGTNKQWFIFLCDERVNNSETGENTAQILVSESNLYPQNTPVPGDTSMNYSAEDTRLIGGFKTNSSGNIDADSIWDIAGKHHTVKAKNYMILDEYATSDSGKHVYRKLRVSDLESSDIESTIDGDLIVAGDTEISGALSVTDNAEVDYLKIADNNDTIHTLGPDIDGTSSGMVLRTLVNPSNGQQVFTVQSYDQSDLLKVEYNGAIVTTNGTFTLNNIDIQKGLTSPTGTESIGIDANLYTTTLNSNITNTNKIAFISLAETTDYASIYVDTTSSNTIVRHRIGSSSNDKIIFESYNGSTASTILSLYGTTTAATNIITTTLNSTTITNSGVMTTASLSASGEVSAASFNATSSLTMKKDISYYENSALDLLNKVKIVEYKFKNDENQENHIGFIAENTPKELSTSNQNKMSIPDCIGTLIKAVQELHQEIKELKNE